MRWIGLPFLVFISYFITCNSSDMEIKWFGMTILLSLIYIVILEKMRYKYEH